MTDDQLIRVRLEGSRTGAGAIDFDALLGFGEHFRRALRAVAREHQGDDPVLSGHPTGADEQASSLRLVGIVEGSAVLELEPSSLEFFAPVMDTLGLLGRAVEAGDLSQSVHASLTEAVRSLGDAASIELTAPQVPRIRIDDALLAQIAPRSSVPVAEAPNHVDGWLHAVDLSPDDFRVLDGHGIDWRCRFDPEHEPLIRSLLGGKVRVTGDIQMTSTRHLIEHATVEPLVLPGMPVVESGLTADEVIRRAMEAAGIFEPQPLSDLRIDFDPDDPDEIAFAEAIESLRLP